MPVFFVDGDIQAVHRLNSLAQRRSGYLWILSLYTQQFQHRASNMFTNDRLTLQDVHFLSHQEACAYRIWEAFIPRIRG